MHNRRDQRRTRQGRIYFGKTAHNELCMGGEIYE